MENMRYMGTIEYLKVNYFIHCLVLWLKAQELTDLLVDIFCQVVVSIGNFRGSSSTASCETISSLQETSCSYLSLTGVG